MITQGCAAPSLIAKGYRAQGSRQGALFGDDGKSAKELCCDEHRSSQLRMTTRKILPH
jgi:hypothetical protein